MIRVAEKEAFYTHLMAERAATWPVAAGVFFASAREHQHWGMALQVEGAVLTPAQLRQALARRFGDPERYSEYFLFLDSRRNFVIWHALPEPLAAGMALDAIRNAQLTLAGLEHLLR
ncbi:type III secretion protein HrpV [Pseudomonas typographi]|uniref:Type III secretion protein HrpV n=1 Tax=Pseudomonas typographi TaxID=2715964 RepID=A0ABR7Z350_9PSED|nr:type III secretion protein HrpV [Pseudomonas typographi]MBD1554533.1 type III secretion protein HrpV [Pseudomonas typographi]MBD1599769.1 type III secretion protein HrpV [Pseudomonas typographi]